MGSWHCPRSNRLVSTAPIEGWRVWFYPSTAPSIELSVPSSPERKVTLILKKLSSFLKEGRGLILNPSLAPLPKGWEHNLEIKLGSNPVLSFTIFSTLGSILDISSPGSCLASEAGPIILIHQGCYKYKPTNKKRWPQWSHTTGTLKTWVPSPSQKTLSFYLHAPDFSTGSESLVCNTLSP